MNLCLNESHIYKKHFRDQFEKLGEEIWFSLAHQKFHLETPGFSPFSIDPLQAQREIWYQFEFQLGENQTNVSEIDSRNAK